MVCTTHCHLMRSLIGLNETQPGISTTDLLEFLKSTAKPLGEIADYAIRIEFQARGSPHAHCVIWVKDAPEYGVDHDSKVCDFIDQYVSCKLPNQDGKLRELSSNTSIPLTARETSHAVLTFLSLPAVKHS